MFYHLKITSQYNSTDRGKILEFVVTQFLRWPKGIFKHICYKNSTLNHLRMNIKKQKISDNELISLENHSMGMFHHTKN